MNFGFGADIGYGEFGEKMNENILDVAQMKKVDYGTFEW
jgi:hypothetical protein